MKNYYYSPALDGMKNSATWTDWKRKAETPLAFIFSGCSDEIEGLEYTRTNLQKASFAYTPNETKRIVRRLPNGNYSLCDISDLFGRPEGSEDKNWNDEGYNVLDLSCRILKDICKFGNRKDFIRELENRTGKNLKQVTSELTNVTSDL